MDLLLTDMALNSFRGTFGSTHGRSYERNKKWAREEATTTTQKLLFGTGSFALHENMSAVCLALSKSYRMPQVLYEIANDLARDELINRQRMGIRLAEAERWGLGFEDWEDGMVFLSLEAYTHPRTIDLVMRVFDAFNWWENDFFEPFKHRRGLLKVLRRLRLLPLVARLFAHDITRNTREQVDIYTYRTPDYMLSSAQDYRKGYGGDQQHVWQATLGPNAVCFTTHPARRQGPSPNYWTGSGSLPRVAQVKNTVIVIYDINTRPGLYLTHRLRFTHAWLPRDQFDEVLEREDWIFARRGEATLRRLADSQPEFFDDLVSIFSGERIDGHLDSDVALVLYPLPRLPVLICYWQPEDGLESRLQIFFDQSADRQLGIRSIYSLAVGLVMMFEKIAHRHL